MFTKETLPDCPVETAVAVIGSNVKLLILYHLLDGKVRFSELQRKMPSASKKVIVYNLRALEKDALILRSVTPAFPVSVEYSLTELGQAIQPVIETVGEWGKLYQAFICKKE